MTGAERAAPAVDIVINNYNYARFLGAAIESACAQTHERTRTIVVDDGSTDDSRRLLRAYEDRVTVILKENGGQASALNAGLERCEGEVVMRAGRRHDADRVDVATRDQLERIGVDVGNCRRVGRLSHLVGVSAAQRDDIPSLGRERGHVDLRAEAHADDPDPSLRNSHC